MNPDVVGTIVAFLFGALGKYLGNGPATGVKKWGKILGPVFAAAAGIGYAMLFGKDLPLGDIFQDGGVLGGQAILIHTIGKNALQLIASYKR